MKIKRKAGYIPVLAVMAAFTVAPVSNAMHIMEGFLAPAYCIAWGLVCVPFIVLGLRSISRIVERDRKTMLLIAMCAAFAFVLSALKIPSVTGSCSHPTGVGLGAVFFGPLATSFFYFRRFFWATAGSRRWAPTFFQWLLSARLFHTAFTVL